MEIERKYLVTEVIFDLSAFENYSIQQSYISLDPEIRIRKQNDLYFLTEKSDGNLVRNECEVEISKEEFQLKEMRKISNTIHKTRYRIPIENNLIAELDIYYGKLNGLIVVEVEFPTIAEAETFIKPYWFGKDITNDKLYKNKYLSLLESWK